MTAHAPSMSTIETGSRASTGTTVCRSSMMTSVSAGPWVCAVSSGPSAVISAHKSGVVTSGDSGKRNVAEATMSRIACAGGCLAGRCLHQARPVSVSSWGACRTRIAVVVTGMSFRRSRAGPGRLVNKIDGRQPAGKNHESATPSRYSPCSSNGAWSVTYLSRCRVDAEWFVTAH